VAKAALVRSTEREIQGLVLQALSQTQMPVALCDWNDDEELEEPQLIIATPWYDSRGPRAAYSVLVEALQKEKVYDLVPIRRVYLKSPADPLVKLLQREVTEAPEGFLHVLRHTEGSYSIVFAPLNGPGSPVPAKHFSGRDDAQQFLLTRLRLSDHEVEKAFREVAQFGNGAIVARFKISQLRRWGLAPSRGPAKTNNFGRKGMKSNGNGNRSGSSHRQSRGSNRTRSGRGL
jgi:hypothetical protein